MICRSKQETFNLDRPLKKMSTSIQAGNTNKLEIAKVVVQNIDFHGIVGIGKVTPANVMSEIQDLKETTSKIFEHLIEKNIKIG